MDTCKRTYKTGVKAKSFRQKFACYGYYILDNKVDEPARYELRCKDQTTENAGYLIATIKLLEEIPEGSEILFQTDLEYLKWVFNPNKEAKANKDLVEAIRTKAKNYIINIDNTQSGDAEYQQLKELVYESLKDNTPQRYKTA